MRFAPSIPGGIGISPPTYSAWLNQGELWFAKIERADIACGVFTSIPDLNRKRLSDIRHYNTQPKPLKGQYFDASRRITPESIGTIYSCEMSRWACLARQHHGLLCEGLNAARGGYAGGNVMTTRYCSIRDERGADRSILKDAH